MPSGTENLNSINESCTSITTTVLRPFFRDRRCETLPEENFWTSWCKGRLTEADTPTIRLGATPAELTSAHLHHPPHFLQAGCPSCRPTNSVKAALKATIYQSHTTSCILPTSVRACRFTAGDRTFPVVDAGTSNRPPQPVTSAPSIPVFRARLKTDLFPLSFQRLRRSAHVTRVILDTFVNLLTYLLNS